jgi:hypothetical protein
VHKSQKWREMEEAADKLHRTLGAIEERIYRGTSDLERRAGVNKWRQAVATVHPEVRDLYSMRGNLGFSDEYMDLAPQWAKSDEVYPSNKTTKTVC